MKKNRIFFAAGTLTLAIAGFLTTKANSKKFAAATSAYFSKAGVIATVYKGLSGWTSLNVTTVFVSGATVTAFFKTVGMGAAKTLFAVRSGSTLSKTAFLIK